MGHGIVVTQTVEQKQKANAADAPRNGQAHLWALGWVVNKTREEAGNRQILPGGIVLFVMPISLHKWLSFPRSL